MVEPERWWRAEDKRYAVWDEWDDGLFGSTLKIELRSFLITRYTPKGVFLINFLGDEVFVRGKAGKQYAVPTKTLAVKDLIARKKLQVHFSKLRLNRAQEHLEAAERYLKYETDSVGRLQPNTGRDNPRDLEG